MRKQDKHSQKLRDITHGQYQSVINLRQIKKYPFYTVSLILILLVFSFIFFTFNRSSTAQVAKFYPQTCLGNWLNVSSASGRPDLGIDSSFEEYDNISAAVYDGGNKQIFCGQFSGDIKPLAKVLEANLHLVWSKTKQREIISTFPNEGIVEEIKEVEEKEEKSSDSSTTSPEEVIKPEEKKPIDQDQVETIETEDGLLNRLFQPAQAQESALDKNKEKNQITTTTATSSFSEDQDSTFQETESEEDNLLEDQLSPETDTDQQVDFIETGPSSTTASNTAGQLSENQDELFSLKYSLDGKYWQELGIISQDNWKEKIINIPIFSVSELEKLQISIEPLAGAKDNLLVLLDGMWIEVRYQGIKTSEITIQDVAHLPRLNVDSYSKQKRRDFKANEEVQFNIPLDNILSSTTSFSSDKQLEEEKNTPPVSDISVENDDFIATTTLTSTTSTIPTTSTTSTTNTPLIDKSTSTSATGSQEIFEKKINQLPLFFKNKNKIKTWREILSKIIFTPQALAQSADLKILQSRVRSKSGQHLKLQPIVSSDGQNLQVYVPKNNRSFQPGEYKVEVEIFYQNQVYLVSQDFSWGVLAFNTNKSIFSTQEEAFLQMAVLNERGHTVCQAPLQLQITDPQGKTTILTTGSGQIIFNKTCGANNVTDQPDYFAYYQPSLPGEYQVFLKNLKNDYEISDNFSVQDNIPFEVERKSATRINPFKSTYKMEIYIRANENFSGLITEKLPSSFDVVEHSASAGFAQGQIEENGQEKKLSWQGSLKKNQEIVLSYEYQAPFVSPYFYLLGELSFTKGKNWLQNILNTKEQIVFQEGGFWQIASDAKANRLAWLTGTNTTNGSNFNQTTAYEMDWSAADVDSDFFTWQAGTSTRLYIEKEGDYLIAINSPMERTDSNATRSRVETTVFLNNTKVEGALSRSSYIRMSGNHSESANNIYFLLTDLSVGDYITVKQQTAPGNTVTGASGPTVASDQVVMLAEFVSTSTRSVFFATSTQTTAGTNLNQASATALEWSSVRKDTGFTHSNGASPENITLADAGNYLLYVNLPWGDPTDSIADRNNLFLRATLDGSPVNYALASQGYIRGDSNSVNGYDYDGSLHFAGIITTNSSNKVLNITVQQEAGNDTITVDGEQGSLYVEKISSEAKLFGAQGTQLATNQNDWNQSAKSPIEWDTQDMADTNVYTHSTTSNTHQIEVEESGDYMLIFNAPLTSGVQRSNVRFSVEVGGIVQAGSYNAPNYIRTANNHSDASAGMVYLLENLTANSVITISGQLEANSGTVNDAAPASVFIWKKEVVGAATMQRHFRWRDDSTALNSDGGWLAQEDGNSTSTFSSINKEQTYRLRFMVANSGTEEQSLAKTYELQFGDKNDLETCEYVSAWSALDDSSTDAFAMSDSSFISPNGASTTASLLSSEGYNFTNGQAMDQTDTTNGIGPMATSTYTEIEYSFQATEEAITGHTYCFRLYHPDSDTSLDGYLVYPEATLASGSFNDIIGEYGTISLSNNSTSTINLSGTYDNVIVVATAEYAPNSQTQRAPRITATTTDSFDIKVDNHASSTAISGSTTVDWWAMEAGSHTLSDGASGWQVIAGNVYTSVTAYNGGWSIGPSVSFSPSFNNPPAVVHTVGSNYDTSWTVSMVNDGTQQGEPIASSMNVSLNTSFDTSGHNAEYINYIAADPLYGTHEGVDFNAVVSADGIVACCSTAGYGVPWSVGAFSTAPEVTLVGQMGEDGGNGGWASTHTGTAGSASTYYATIDEDGPSADRTHTQEVVGHIGFDSSSGFIGGAVLALDQTTYRIFENTDAVQPTTGLAATNTPATGVADTDVVRLRMTVQAGLDTMATSTRVFKLQWGEATSTCAQISTWSDVGATSSSAIWRGYDNPSVADETTISASLLNNQNNTLQTYEEQNLSATNTSAIADGQRGEWDWVLQNNSATSSTSYCFRMVTQVDEELNYSQYPQITTTGGGSLAADIVDSGGSPVSSPQVSFTSGTVGYACQSLGSTFGTSTEQIRITNTTAGPQWTLTVAASSSQALWQGSSYTYDFNDSSGSPPGCSDGGDGDSLAGQLSMNPTVASISPQSGCSQTGLSLGSASSFSEGVVDDITVVTAGSGSDTDCYWDLTGMSVSQQLPAEQEPDNYSIDVILTITAS